MSVFVLLLTGCAKQGDAASRAESTGGWHRIQTEHIDLVTNLGDAAALEAVIALERTRGAMLQAAWSGRSSTRHVAPLRVIALANGLEFERYFGLDVNGLQTLIGGSTLVLWGQPSHWERRPDLKIDVKTSTLRHEMAHHLEPAGIEQRRDKEILDEWRRHPGLGPSQIRNQLRRESIKISVNTVRRVMEEAGYRPPKVERKPHD